MGTSSNKRKKEEEKKFEEKKIEENIKKEAYIEGHAEAISLDQITTITEQMKKSICKINNGLIKGTGFICLIPNPKIDHLLRVLITCNHVYNDLTIGNQIDLEFNEKSKNKILIIDDNRKTYTDSEYDITIIELKENEFDDNDYLKIDDLMNKKKELKEIYANKQIYIIHYPKGKEVKKSQDIITNIENNKI